VISNFIPAASSVRNAAKAVKKAKDAGAGFFRQAVEGLKKLLRDKVKEMVTKAKRNFRKWMRKDGRQLREDLMDDILYGGAEALTAQMVADKMENEYKEVALDIVRAVDPTGIADAVHAFSAESCGDVRIENMPTDGLDDRAADDWQTWNCRIAKRRPSFRSHRGEMGLGDCQDRCKDDYGEDCRGVEWKRSWGCLTYRDDIDPAHNPCSDGWWVSVMVTARERTGCPRSSRSRASPH